MLLGRKTIENSSKAIKVMKTIRRISVIVLLTIFSSITMAQSAYVEDVWIERNVNINGVYCLKVHSTIDISNLRGCTCQVGAYVFYEDGSKVSSLSPYYMTPDGQVVSMESVRPIYNDSRWEDLIIYIPNSVIWHNSSTSNYYIYIAIFYGNRQLALYDKHTSRNSFSMSSSSDYAYPATTSSSSGSAIGAVAGAVAIGAALYGLSKLFSDDGSSSSSSSSSSSYSSSSSTSYNDLYVSTSDIQSTNSYYILDNIRFYSYKNADYEYATIVLKNGHDYILYKSRNTSSSSRYYIYVHDIDGKKSPSKRYYATSSDAIDAIEKMDCRFCKWFKNKKGRNATYSEFTDWYTHY